MNEKTENVLLKSTMTYGLYIGVAFSILMLLFNFAGKIHTPADKSGLFNTLILSFGMLYFGRQYQRSYFESGISYAKALGFAILLSVFSSIIFAFFCYWFYNIIEPEAVNAYVNMIDIAMKESLLLADEQRKIFVEMYRSPGMIAFATFFNQSLTGIILALVVSFFIKSPLNLSNSQQR